MHLTNEQSQANNLIYESRIPFYLDIHLHSASRKLYIGRKNQALKTSFQYRTFLPTNITHCAIKSQRYVSFLTPPTGIAKLLESSPASSLARCTRQTNKINNSLKSFEYYYSNFVRIEQVSDKI